MSCLLKFVVFFSLLITLPSAINAISPVVPEMILTPEEIDKIIDEKNFFHHKEMEEQADVVPIWVGQNRKYIDPALKARTHYYGMGDVVHHVLSNGFPVRYQLENLYRAKQGIHARVGDILPKISLAFGEDVSGLNVGSLFSGLIGFLLPSNWLRLAGQIHAHRAARYMLEKIALDQSLKAKLLYITQHKMIKELEIKVFYLVQLQLFRRLYSQQTTSLLTFSGIFGAQGMEMSAQRGAVRLGFDDLALVMALENTDGNYSVKNININDIEDFPLVVEDFDVLEPIFRDKEKFLEEVVRKSVELQAVKELLSLSKLNVGISVTDPVYNSGLPGDNRFLVRLGYGTIPNILIAQSASRTAKIDVRNEYINMLDMARRVFDLHANAIGGYTEAKRSLELNREALIGNMKRTLAAGVEPDGAMIFAIINTLNSEIRLNTILHESLVARAYMGRFLLTDGAKIARYLPEDEKVREFFNQIKKTKIAEDKLDHLLQKVRKESELKHILYERESDGFLKQFSEEDIVHACNRNLTSLVYSRWNRHKTRSFFQLLDKYVRDHQIELTSEENLRLNRGKSSFWQRLFAGRTKDAKYWEDFAFEDFPQPAPHHKRRPDQEDDHEYHYPL